MCPASSRHPGDPNDTRAYRPVNYDGNFHGPVTVRTALANSFNIPAVKTLDFVKIYDDPSTPQRDGMIAMAEKLGITCFTRPDYGLALTLGGGDVSLLELTAAYSVIANSGRKVRRLPSCGSWTSRALLSMNTSLRSLSRCCAPNMPS